MTRCEMKGFLSLTLLWLISRKEMTGAEIALEIQKRRGQKPSPGTIYPALKDLKDKGLIDSDEGKKYVLTKKGKKELDEHLNTFLNMFCDLEEMKSCCGRH